MLVDAPVHHTIELVNTVKDMHNNRKEKKKQTNQTAQTTQTATPQFQVDKEAMDFIFGSSDPYAKHLKESFLSFHKSDLSTEKKYAAYQFLYRRAREYMSKKQ